MNDNNELFDESLKFFAAKLKGGELIRCLLFTVVLAVYMRVHALVGFGFAFCAFLLTCLSFISLFNGVTVRVRHSGFKITIHRYRHTFPSVRWYQLASCFYPCHYLAYPLGGGISSVSNFIHFGTRYGKANNCTLALQLARFSHYQQLYAKNIITFPLNF